LTGEWITAEQACSADYWAAHLRHAVRFEDGVRTLASDPSLQLLEVGPGQALASMSRACLGQRGAGRVTASLANTRSASRDDPAAEKQGVLEGAAKLWLA